MLLVPSRAGRDCRVTSAIQWIMAGFAISVKLELISLFFLAYRVCSCSYPNVILSGPTFHPSSASFVVLSSMCFVFFAVGGYDQIHLVGRKGHVKGWVPLNWTTAEYDLSVYSKAAPTNEVCCIEIRNLFKPTLKTAILGYRPYPFTYCQTPHQCFTTLPSRHFAPKNIIFYNP